jgi:hypothetical protein
MQIIHLTNTDFEFELAHPDSSSIEQSWIKMPSCLQLQTLALLYAQSNEAIVVTSPPSDSFIEEFLFLTGRTKEDLPHFISLNDTSSLSGWECLSWGFSRKVQRWAQERQAMYVMPDWKIVQEVNSKEFSFQESPHLNGSRLIANKQDLEQWLTEIESPKVLKTCYGLSGHGHRLIQDSNGWESVLPFCQKEWRQQRPLIGEPWLERILDFSTQWYLSQKGVLDYIGATKFEVNQVGSYLGTCVGPEQQLFNSFYGFLIDHKKKAEELIEKMAKKGFFGYLGMDAFLYKNHKGSVVLRPIVEVNGRLTMSLAALRLQQRNFPQEIICLSYVKDQSHAFSLVPTQIQTTQGQVFSFNKKLLLSHYST